MDFVATAAFGLEGVVKRELHDLGIDASAEGGCARFSGTPNDAFRACMWLRAADRVLLLIGEKKVETFDELFRFVRGLPWHEVLPRDAAFPVDAKCARSKLMSPRDCQTITKKAVAEALKARYQENWLPESGETYQIDVKLHGDIARVTVDLCGDALNRRGYRTWNGEAPLRETLAAAMVMLSPWNGATPLHDPCFGTGTLLIEAAFRQADRAPGLNRAFACEKWRMFPQKTLDFVRADARKRFQIDRVRDISGSDIDPEALSLCARHIGQAGLTDRIKVWQSDLRDLTLDKADVTFIANPPYGERMSDRKSCEKLYKDLRLLRARHAGARLCVLTAHPGFERCYGGKAQTRRRLYNGRLECEYMVFR